MCVLLFVLCNFYAGSISSQSYCSGSIFKQFDLDNNNEISKPELEQLIRTVKFGEFQPNYEDVVKELFNDFDKDGNNTINEPEFVDGLKKWVDKAIHAANSSDKANIIDEYDKVSITDLYP